MSATGQGMAACSRERPINFRATRHTKIKIPSPGELTFRVVRTPKGNRLYVCGPDGLEIQHVHLPGESSLTTGADSG